MSLTVFTYHRVLPKAHPDALSADVFERQLDFLEKKFKVVTPDEALDFIAGKSRDTKQPLAMLSFDDGWLDNWLFATPILKRRGLKAALALSTGFLHDAPVRERVEDVPAEIVERPNLEAEKTALNGDVLCYLSRSEVRAMHDSGCWTIEAHGTCHAKNNRNISSLAAPATGVSIEEFEKALKADLENCIDEINTITERAPKMMFWPWGQYSKRSVQVAKSLGFDIQFTTAKGPVSFGDTREVLPRVNAAGNWNKFTRNSFMFSRPLLAYAHDIFAHTETLCIE